MNNTIRQGKKTISFHERGWRLRTRIWGPDARNCTLGWTMACGSGRVIVDLISGRTPEISLAGLRAARF